MDKEFHYYITYLAAIAAGQPQENAYKIAYSSQLVDDNNCDIVIKFRNKYYHNILTQTYDPTHSKAEHIWQSLHFIPGCKGRSNRVDRAIDRRLVTPNNKIAKIFLQFALNSGNPYMIGIAAHGYADSWAHQNFIGSFSALNILDNEPNYLLNHFGHMDALDWPDLVNLKWQDNRLKLSEISNKGRFLEAASALYSVFRNGKRRLNKADFIKSLDDLIGSEITIDEIFYAKSAARARVERYMEFAYKLSGERMEEYRVDHWLRSSSYNRFGKFYGRDNFLKSDYYAFNVAAKKYLNFTAKVLRSV